MTLVCFSHVVNSAELTEDLLVTAALETQSDILDFDATGELSSSLDAQIHNLKVAHKISFEIAFEILDKTSQNILQK